MLWKSPESFAHSSVSCFSLSANRSCAERHRAGHRAEPVRAMISHPFFFPISNVCPRSNVVKFCQLSSSWDTLRLKRG